MIIYFLIEYDNINNDEISIASDNIVTVNITSFFLIGYLNLYIP
jgi:hypothetical protein